MEPIIRNVAVIGARHHKLVKARVSVTSNQTGYSFMRFKTMF